MTSDARDRAPQADRRDEVFGPQEVRPKNRVLTDTSRDDDDYCVSIATMPPGVVVPLHSHADREWWPGTPDAPLRLGDAIASAC